jgi:MarR family transcriptional regulator, organic hydroperoxide resistance regulator
VRPAEEVRFLILAAQRDGNRQLAQALRPLGLTPSQAEALRVLADGQPLTLAELGGLLVCESGSSPSRLIDRLVTAGLIQRVEAGHDRRHVQLTLTADGAELADRVVEIEEQLYRTIDAAGTGPDRDAAISYLRALVGGRPAGIAFANRATRAARSTSDGSGITG